MDKKNNELIKKALENAKKIVMYKDNDGKDVTYLDTMLNQRIEGPTNAGSSYNMSKEELLNKLLNGKWEEVEHPGVKEGCRCFKMPLKGLEGILDIKDLPETTNFYAIDPKHTGNISVGAAGIQKKEVDDTYLIVGKDDINGIEDDVVFTFHPGEPVAPSNVTTQEIPDGKKLSLDEIKNLGFDKVKFMSKEMEKEYIEKNDELIFDEYKISPEERTEDNLWEMLYNKLTDGYHFSELEEAIVRKIGTDKIKKHIEKYPSDIYAFSPIIVNNPELINIATQKLGFVPNLKEDSEILKEHPELKENLKYNMKGFSFKQKICKSHYSDKNSNDIYTGMFEHTYFLEKNNEKYEFTFSDHDEDLMFSPYDSEADFRKVDEFTSEIDFPIKPDEDSKFFIESTYSDNIDSDHHSLHSKFFDYYQQGGDYTSRKITVNPQYFEGAEQALEKAKLEVVEYQNRKNEEKLNEEKEKSQNDSPQKKFRTLSDLIGLVINKNKEDKEIR